MTSGAPVLDRKYRRRSALQAYACPLHFREVYVKGRRIESAPARRGTAFHLVFRRYVDLLLQHQCEDDLDLAQQAFREAGAASQVPLAILQEVDQLWSRFVPTFHLDVDSVLMHEERPDDEYDWQPDLVRVYGDVLDITDLKTHWAVLNQEAANSAFQVAMYSARARKVWPGFSTYRFTLWFVRWGILVHVELTQADIDRHEEQLAILEAGIATSLQLDEWPPVPGETCQYCDIACPVADDAVLHPVRLQTRGDAERVLGEYLALEQASTARRRALESFTDFEGPVRLNGVEFGPRPTQRVTFPIARVLEVFAQHGVQATFSVSKTALKPYLTQVRYRHVAPALEALGEVKAGTEYRVRKVGDVAPALEEGVIEA